MEVELWPMKFMGRDMVEVPLTQNERTFYKNFPGKAGQFETESESLILRKVYQATRKLHPAQDCFKGMGYTVNESGLKLDEYERVWSSFEVSKSGSNLVVMELIKDDAGNSWSDVSSWYWAAALKRSEGPWTSYVRIIRSE